jgi:hypothetical protein
LFWAKKRRAESRQLPYPMILQRSGNVTGRAFLEKLLSIGVEQHQSLAVEVKDWTTPSWLTSHVAVPPNDQERSTLRDIRYVHFLLHLESSISTMAQFCTTVCMTILPRSLACRGELPCGYIHFISLKPARPISIRCAAEVYD